MPVAEAILASITKAVASFALSQGGKKVSDALKRRPAQQAFKRSLRKAIEQLKVQHPGWTKALLEAGAFEAGSDILAQLLLRNGESSPVALAKRWLAALPPTVVEQMGLSIRSRELEAVATDFLESFSHFLTNEPELQSVFDSQALERTAKSVEAIRLAFGADKVTPGTRLDYFNWLIERNSYVDPRGIAQTQRQVQVALEDVYISLRAQSEKTFGHAEAELLEHELKEYETELVAMPLLLRISTIVTDRFHRRSAMRRRVKSWR